MTPAEINAIGVMLASLRDDGEAAVVVTVAAHGPSIDMPDGSLAATVTTGPLTATASAKYLADAIGLARADIRRQAARREKSQENANA